MLYTEIAVYLWPLDKVIAMNAIAVYMIPMPDLHGATILNPGTKIGTITIATAFLDVEAVAAKV